MKESSETLVLNKEFILLDLTRETLDEGKLLGGIYIPFSKRNALTKTITCKIKDINEETSKKYNINIGDEILVDRYAILRCNGMNDDSKTFYPVIRCDSVLMIHNPQLKTT